VTEPSAFPLRYSRRFCGVAFALALLVTLAAAGLDAAALNPQESHAAAEEAHSLWPTFWKIVNFAILVGLLVYFLRGYVSTYFRTRTETVRRELVEAASLRSEAERQLSDVRSQLAALPAELETLRRHGEEELASERARMKAATEQVREQLLERTRRDIEFQFRQARRELVAHIADLAMSLARRRIERNITLEDQVRLIDRYAAEVQL
jgi:F-type H+-transporting ATPase subunit b